MTRARRFPLILQYGSIFLGVKIIDTRVQIREIIAARLAWIWQDTFGETTSRINAINMYAAAFN